MAGYEEQEMEKASSKVLGDSDVFNAVKEARRVEHVVHLRFCEFNKDCVALRGMNIFYLKRSDEEMGDAVSLADYLMKGGCVRLKNLGMDFWTFSSNT